MGLLWCRDFCIAYYTGQHFFNQCHDEFILGNIRHIQISSPIPFSALIYGKRELKLFLTEDDDPTILHSQQPGCRWPVASFTKEVNSRLAKRPLVFNGRLANLGLTSLVKEATGERSQGISSHCIDSAIRVYYSFSTRRINLTLSSDTGHFTDWESK